MELQILDRSNPHCGSIGAAAGVEWLVDAFYERVAWMLCLRGALAEMVADAALRGQLETAFGRLADKVRNAPGSAQEQGGLHRPPAPRAP